MSTISGTKMYSSNGLSGLVSGMDTESIVEKLLSGTQSKIDTQYGKKQQLLWKQEIYRDIISDLRTFQTKFFSYSNPTSNLLSNAYFNSLTSDIGSSTALKVTASSSAATGKTSIDYIKKLASATKKTSGSEVSGKIEGTIDLSKIKATAEVTIKIGDTEHKVTLNASSQPNLVQSINDALGSDGTASINADGKLVIDAGSKDITVSGSSDGLAVLGLNKTTTVTGKLETMHDLSKGVPYLTINMDGVERNILIDFTYTDTTDFVTKLNSKITSTIGSGLTVEQKVPGGNEVIFKADGGRQVTLAGGSALEAFGIEKGTSNKINLYTKLKDVNFAEKLNGETFIFKINGVTFAASGEENLKSIMDRVNNSDAGVTMSYSSSQDKFVIESKTSGEGVDIQMSQDTGNLLTVLFGAKPSGSVASGQLKKDHITSTNVSSFADVETGEFKLIINGTEIKLTLPEKTDAGGNPEKYTEEQALAEINKQLEGCIIGGTVTLEKNADNKIVINASPECNVSLPSTIEADSIAEKFGFTADQSTKADSATTLTDLGMSGTITVGSTTIDLAGIATIGDLATQINTALGGNGNCTFDDASGSLMIKDVTSAITISGDSLDKLFGSDSISLQAADETILSSGNDTITGATTINSLGISGTLKVGAKTIDLSTVTDINDLSSKIQTELGSGTISFDDTKGGFVICGVNIPVTIEALEGDEAGKAAMQKLFGAETIEIQNDGSVSAFANKGTNAVLSVNGKEIEKNTNNFTMDGLDIELKETTDKAVTIDTTKNTEQVQKGIEDFVNEYNKMIEKLNGLVNEDADYKKYDPLTDAQRKEMSEDQIKLWEEKAKSGLVRNDSTVRGILQEMRGLLYEKPAGCDIALYDLGIETSRDYKDYGKLVIKDPAKLKNAIETKGEEVQKLFTSETDGLAVKFNKALDNAAKASTATPGSLVQLAGIKGGTLDGNNSIDNNIKDIDKTVKSLNMKYKKEKTRYWNQFNAMEKMIQQMNQQSSWLMQQFS